jgi:O-antigen ligase
VVWYAPFIKAVRAGTYLAAHVIVASTLISAIYVVQLLLIYVGDPKLFDLVPIRFIFDAMDGFILIAFVAFGTIEAIRVFQGHTRDD